MDEEAVRVISSMPDWKPGKKDGKPVDANYTVPVEFVLENYPVIKSRATSTITATKPLYIIDGEEFKGSMDDINPDNIKSIDVLKGESAIELYGEKGKNGVIVITSKKFAEKNKITSELELRKFIAKNIKYPVEAQEANKTGTIQLFIELNNSGRVIKISEKASGDELFLDEVVVVAYKNKDEVIIKDNLTDTENSALKNEVERIIRQLPKIEMPEYEGKTVGITVKFMLQ